MSEMSKRDLQRVERAYLHLAEARTEARIAIQLARASGEKLEDIARAAGVSRQAISKALRERE
jgi:hypothetical protein